MNGNKTTCRNRDAAVDDFVAELTQAAYPVALRYGARDRWLDLELGLYKALTDAVKKWDRRAIYPPA
jgi:hypothetical protein